MHINNLFISILHLVVSGFSNFVVNLYLRSNLDQIFVNFSFNFSTYFQTYNPTYHLSSYIHIKFQEDHISCLLPSSTTVRLSRSGKFHKTIFTNSTHRSYGGIGYISISFAIFFQYGISIHLSRTVAIAKTIFTTTTMMPPSNNIETSVATMTLCGVRQWPGNVILTCHVSE